LKIAEVYSHLNGLEYLEARQPALWEEIREVIHSVDVGACRTKVSQELRMRGRILYSPPALNLSFNAGFKARGWRDVRTSYWVCSSPIVNRRILELPDSEQKQAILSAGLEPIRSQNQIDFVKDRIAVEVQFGKYAFVAYDIFVKHMAFYVTDKIDLGIEVLPMKCLQREMSSGPSYYESELYNLVREGRGVPPVPLILIGVAP